MSKASEFAKDAVRSKNLSDRRPSFGGHAQVDDDGDLRLYVAVPAKKALAFARWILDTYSDAPQARAEGEAIS